MLKELHIVNITSQLITQMYQTSFVRHIFLFETYLMYDMYNYSKI